MWLSKEKVMINQSRYHIIIEPNNNGFDKYLIQEIIQEYAKTMKKMMLDVFPEITKIWAETHGW